MRSLNLLVHLDNFRWDDINLSRSKDIDQLAEIIETLIVCKDRCWHHPDCYTLCYSWGCIHELIEMEFGIIKKSPFNWITHNNHKTLIKFWKTAFHQSSSSNLTQLKGNYPHELNGLTGYLNDIVSAEFVDSPEARHELVVRYCSHNNNLIQWDKSKSKFLPNINYSNQFLASRVNTLNTDLRERAIEVPKLSAQYCNEDYKKELTGGRSREALAEELGKEVARRNFYKYERELSTEESRLRKSLRCIHSIERNGRKMFLSIDFEKCIAFEWCNEKGNHLGEYRFDGILNGDADPTNAHDIWALK